MRSRDDFPMDSSWFVSLWPTEKCRKTRSDMILVTNLLSESSALWRALTTRWQQASFVFIPNLFYSLFFISWMLRKCFSLPLLFVPGYWVAAYSSLSPSLPPPFSFSLCFFSFFFFIFIFLFLLYYFFFFLFLFYP